MKNGPSRTQLAQKVKRLESELAKFRHGDRLRREGEHWYEIVALHDPSGIKQVSSPIERTFFIGMLEHIYLFEYPRGTTTQEVEQFMAFLRSKGIGPSLAIQEGARFVKLAAIPSAQEEELDKQLSETMEASHAETGESAGTPADATGARPELSGDGVGGGGSDDVDDHRSGGDRDEASPREGASDEG